MKMLLVVYKITFLIDSKTKYYFGQTNNFKQRMRNHRSGTQIVSWAIKKYGYVKAEIIFKSYDAVKINKKEKDLIAKYDTTNPNKGFNISKGHN